MKTLYRVIIIIVSNTLSLYIASRLIPGFNIQTNIIGFLEVGTVMGIVNIFIRPIVKLLSLPLVLLTFGLFSAIINIVLLYFTSYLFPFFQINSLLAGILGLITISFTNSILTNIFKK